jgi:hypothetical protein
METKMSYKQGIYANLIDRFADSGYKICEVTLTESDRQGRSNTVLLNGINRAMERSNKFHMKAIQKNDKIYLVNTLTSKNKQGE